MKTFAQNSIRISPRKIRLLVSAVKNMPVDKAEEALSVMGKRGALDIAKVLKSAVANAVNNSKLEKSKLKISSIEVSETAALKRYRPSTRGRVHPYKKRGSKVKIVLEEVQNGT